MTNVSVNGHKLHEVEMLLTSYSENTLSYLKYPEHRIETKLERDKLLLRIPAFLAIELYRRAILPQNPEEDVSVNIDGRDIGRFVVVDFRYPVQGREIVSITLQRLSRADAQTQET